MGGNGGAATSANGTKKRMKSKVKGSGLKSSDDYYNGQGGTGAQGGKQGGAKS